MWLDRHTGCKLNLKNMYVYKWIEGEKQMIDFCQKRFKMKPHFCETIGHCGPATIHMIYKYKDENDRSKGCAQMFFLFMEHPNGKVWGEELDKIERWTYEQIRTDRTSLVE